MNLFDYFDTPGALSVGELAQRIGIKDSAQIRAWRHAYGGRRPSPENCVSIEVATRGKVTRQDLRPDDWARIWPELVRKRARA